MPDKKYYRVSYGELFKTGDTMFAEVDKRLFIDFNNDRDTIDYTLKISFIQFLILLPNQRVFHSATIINLI